MTGRMLGQEVDMIVMADWLIAWLAGWLAAWLLFLCCWQLAAGGETRIESVLLRRKRSVVTDCEAPSLC